MPKTYLRIEIKSPVSSSDVIEQADLLTQLKEPLEKLKSVLSAEGTEVNTKFVTERGPLSKPRQHRQAA
jgi:hypothetical protein